MKAHETPTAVYCPGCGYRLARIVPFGDTALLTLDWPRGWYFDRARPNREELATSPSRFVRDVISAARGDDIWRRGRARRTRDETTEGGDGLTRYPAGAPVECPRCREIVDVGYWPRPVLPSE